MKYKSKKFLLDLWQIFYYKLGVLISLSFCLVMLMIFSRSIFQGLMNYIESDNSVDFACVYKWIVLNLVVVLGVEGLWRLFDWLSLHYLPYIKQMIILRLTKQISTYKYEYFQSRLPNEIMQIIQQISDSTYNIIENYLTILRYAVTVICYFIFIYITNSLAAYIVLSWLCIWSICVYYVSIANTPKSMALSLHRMKFFVKLTEFFSNIISVWKNHTDMNYINKYATQYYKKRVEFRFHLWLWWCIQGIMFVFITYFISYFLYLEYIKGTLLVSNWTIIMYSIYDISHTLWDASDYILKLQEDCGELEQSLQLINYPLQNNDKLPAIIITDGSISISDVIININAQTFYFDKLNIMPNSTTAIVGKSGAGKTTLVEILLRLLDIQEGKIIIDKQNIYEHSVESLRAQISYISQKSELFEDTIYNNLTYGVNNIEEVEVYRVAQIMYIHEKILSLPNGYDTILNDTTFSQGERQRIVLARYILQKPVIGILDEATSSLDNLMERHVLQTIRSMIGTKIIIAHKLHNLIDMDMIVMIHEYKIVASGTHDDLYKTNDVYRKMFLEEKYDS